MNWTDKKPEITSAHTADEIKTTQNTQWKAIGDIYSWTMFQNGKREKGNDENNKRSSW